MRFLVVGWFSFEQMGATAGDLITRDLLCDWLEQADFDYDIALAPPFEGGVNWQTVNPMIYSHVVFVCGPFGNGWPITDFLPRFANCTLIGINLSMLESLDTWNPFDLLLERDSSRTSRPDLSFLSTQGKVPVVGLMLVHPQKEYGEKALHKVANDAIQRLVDSREMSVVPIDTRLDLNSTGLRSPAEVESLIARMDVVLTTRLHGTVLSLKNGIPVVAIDPIAKGAKIRRQAETIGWSLVFTADALTDAALQEAFDYCQTEKAREQARQCGERARSVVRGLHDEFIAALSRAGGRRRT